MVNGMFGGQYVDIRNKLMDNGIKENHIRIIILKKIELRNV